MGGRRPLKAGAVRLLGRHDGATGRAFRRCFDALTQAFDLSTPLARLEASRVAAAWVNVEVSTRALETARRARANGRGRRPGGRDIERAARRQGLADGSYSQGLDKLRALVGGRKPLTIAEELSQRRAEADEPDAAERPRREATSLPRAASRRPPRDRTGAATRRPGPRVSRPSSSSPR